MISVYHVKYPSLEPTIILSSSSLRQLGGGVLLACWLYITTQPSIRIVYYWCTGVPTVRLLEVGVVASARRVISPDQLACAPQASGVR